MDVIFSDFDFTIIFSDHLISDSVRKKLAWLKNNDTCFVLVTGRGRTNLIQAKARDRLDFVDIFVGNNGAVMMNRDFQVLKYSSISSKVLTELVNRMLKLSFSFEKMEFAGLDEIKIFQTEKEILEFVKKTSQVIQVTLVVTIGFPVEKLKEVISDLPINIAVNIAASEMFIDITLKNINKGKAIEEFIKMCPDAIERCFAIGDGENDIPMLAKVEESFTFVNSSSKVQAYAKHLVPNFESFLDAILSEHSNK